MGTVHIEKNFGRYLKDKGINVSMKIGFDLKDPTVLQIAQESKKALQLCKKIVEAELNDINKPK